MYSGAVAANDRSPNGVNNRSGKVIGLVQLQIGDIFLGRNLVILGRAKINSRKS